MGEWFQNVDILRASGADDGGIPSTADVECLVLHAGADTAGSIHFRLFHVSAALWRVCGGPIERGDHRVEDAVLYDRDFLQCSHTCAETIWGVADQLQPGGILPGVHEECTFIREDSPPETDGCLVPDWYIDIHGRYQEDI